jgi:hypothetical protein
MHQLGGGWLFVEAGLLVVALAAILLVRRAMARAGGEDWHERTAAIAGDVRTAAERRPTEPSRLRREVLPLANRLEGQTRSPPADAPPELVEAVDELSERCHRLTFEAAGEATIALEDRLDALAARAADVERLACDRDPDHGEGVAGAGSEPGAGPDDHSW